jgi:hypothetical protein
MSEDWLTSDDWETPDHIARLMADLVFPDERCLEPSAGGGQIAQYLPTGSDCVEISPRRVERGKVLAPDQNWFCADFFQFAKEQRGQYDCIITNPPFSKGVEFIATCLELLSTSKVARLILLLPCDYFQAQKRAELFGRLPAHISEALPIVGRVAYLKNGVPVSGRQIYDTVYLIQRGFCSKFRSEVRFLQQKDYGVTRQ